MTRASCCFHSLVSLRMRCLSRLVLSRDFVRTFLAYETFHAHCMTMIRNDRRGFFRQSKFLNALNQPDDPRSTKQNGTGTVRILRSMVEWAILAACERSSIHSSFVDHLYLKCSRKCSRYRFWRIVVNGVIY